ncbi:MAG: hypothetical protein Q9186_004207 [Xanthomendoza sp. 1 TL-2023]
MNSVRNTSTLQSKVFEIVVGPSEESFYVHANILARSEVLKKAVEGSFREREESKIVWPHWTVSAAEAFLEWLYKDDYPCPYPVPVIPPVEASEDKTSIDTATKRSLPEEDVDNDVLPTSTPDSAPVAKKQKPDAPSATLQPLSELFWSGPMSPRSISQAEEFDTWTGHQLWSPDQLDYHATFMLHAELYVMGCHYMLDELKGMAWQRLRAVLVTIGRPSMESNVIGNMIDLVRYVYNETGQIDEEEEPLRNLITTFVALHLPSFKNSGIEDMALSRKEDDPEHINKEFVSELSTKLILRIENLEQIEAEKAKTSNVPAAAGNKLTSAVRTAPDT